MGGRWWLLFRGLAVPTVLFFAPVLAIQELRPLSYLLSVRGAVAEVALGIFAVLLLEALCATLLALILSAGHAIKLWNDRADTNCAGLLTLAIAVLCGVAALYPLDGLIGRVAGAGLQAALILAVIVLLTLCGWQRAFALFNRLNQSAQMVLAVGPLLLIPVLTGGFGWRSFDPMPPARPFAPSASTKPNVVLISFDALTAQDMSLYGYKLPTTPQFERLAQRSYNFVNFVSSSDFTTPAVASLLTGQYPLTNRVFQLYGHIPHRLRKDNLAWILRRHGYTTAAIVTNPAAHPLSLRLADSFSSLPWPPVSSWIFPGTVLMQLRHSLLFNAANGFAVNAFLRLGCLFGRFNKVSWVQPRAVFASARDFIRGARTPYFLWVHLYPPHAPYVADARFQGRFLPGSAFTTQAQYFWETPWVSYPPAMQHEIDLLRLRYDERITECDSALGEFLDWMATSHRDTNTILVVTADHGENFSDGYWSHESPDLHYAETHIPLLISLPHQSRGYTETEDGDLTDVAPTLLALLGMGTPSWMDGHSLLDPARAASLPEPSFSMYLAQSDPFSRPAIGAIAANSGPYHLVWYFPSGGVELFDIARDPEQRHYVLALHPPYPPGMAMALAGDIQRRFVNALNGRPPVKRP
ncbi:MAG TPA: sulfatase [Candidatus Binataceae bacterium]|nr:sulfatase [Candidatus Binataceae bacterium]